MLVQQGLGRDEILLRFRDRYGEKILSSPTAEGFNLTAWILPFAALAAGAAIVLGTLRRWTSRRRTGSSASPAAISAADRERLETELREGA